MVLDFSGLCRTSRQAQYFIYFFNYPLQTRDRRGLNRDLAYLLHIYSRDAPYIRPVKALCTATSHLRQRVDPYLPALIPGTTKKSHPRRWLTVIAWFT